MNSQIQKTINVLVVDDHKLFRDGFVKFLKCFDDIGDCDDVRSGELAIEAIKEKFYSIVMLDRRMDGIGGLETGRKIKSISPNTKIIVMTGIGAEDVKEVIAMIEMGIDGYIFKGIDDDYLDEIITFVLRGVQYFNPEITKIYNDYLLKSKSIMKELLNTPLTKKELQVLKLIRHGKNSEQIADILCISINTVKSHRQNIKNKLNLHTTAELVEYAISIGL